MTSSEKRPFTKVIIIGIGFSGLTMACKLKTKLNCDEYTIYDRSAAPGGTWWANKYPGCAVDIPAAFYTLSFAPNPDFSNVFPPQADIIEYFNGVVERFGVYRHVVPNTEWVGAYWQDLTSTWLVKLKDLSTGGTFYQECKILISAVGGLVNPNTFDVPGVDTFEGDIIHTARWKTDTSLRQKDVIVVGNGCSAAQLVPAIADEAKNITQFMRTPQHYVENDNMQISGNWKMLFRYVPGVLWILRIIIFLYLESTATRFNVDGSGSSRAREKSSRKSEEYIKKYAPEEYWPLLIPKYDIGCKRRVFDNSKYIGYLQRSNIHLTDDPIVALQQHSVMTQSGQQYPADIIILATGFSLTQYDVELIGRNGHNRNDHWSEYGYKEAYKSIAMSGFPNFFYVLGPNSGKSHTSTIYSIENYTNLITRVIAPIIKGHSSFVEVKADREKLYNQRLHAAIAKTVFNNSCGSYFIDQKSQKNWFIYPWNSFFMWYSMHWGSADDWTYNVQPSKKQGVLNSELTVLILTLGMILFCLGAVLDLKSQLAVMFSI